MAHDLEFIDGEASIAYSKTGGLPWHGLGKEVPDDLTPEQMMKAAQLDWNVRTEPCYTTINGQQVQINKQALIRDRDDKVLDIISDDWQPCQNSEAFEFFNDFIAAGDMKMETAGSLKGGKIIWAMAKTGEAFELFGGKDRVEAYLLFTNPHSYGQSIDIRSTGTRVVCNNTLSLAHSTKSKSVVKVNHRRKFDADQVKETLGVTKARLHDYHEAAKFLSSKRYTNETLTEYFKRVFPTSGGKDLSRNAEKSIQEWIFEQPGHELGEGSFWQAFNTTSWAVDHVIGRSDAGRIANAWYGNGSKLKMEAMNLALEMAKAA